MHTLIKAFIEGSTISAASVSLTADDDSTITAHTGSAVLSGSVGAISGSISISVAIARNEIANEVEAFVLDSHVTATGDDGILIEAIGEAGISAISMAASAALNASWLGGIAIAGGGANAFNSILTKTWAYADKSDSYAGTSELQATTGGITLQANDDSDITAKVITTSDAFSAGGTFAGAVAIGGASAELHRLGHGYRHPWGLHDGHGVGAPDDHVWRYR